MFLDGMRHAAEIVTVAYRRLRQGLTDAAFIHSSGAALPDQTFPVLFLDAWAIVDAIDRLRSLLLNFPNGQRLPAPPGEVGFIAATERIRSLRNVADHLATRVDYVVAMESGALGKLSWVTCIDTSSVLVCSLLPGTVSAGRTKLVNPVGKTIDPPTDLITLSAGEYEASLSDAVAHTGRAIALVEESLAQSFERLGVGEQQAGADVMVAVRIGLSTEQTHLTDDDRQPNIA